MELSALAQGSHLETVLPHAGDKTSLSLTIQGWSGHSTEAVACSGCPISGAVKVPVSRLRRTQFWAQGGAGGR